MNLRDLASDDVFSAAWARQFGVTSSYLRRCVQSESAFALHRGWYAVRPPRDDRDRHWLRLSALLQEYAGQAIASHGSALVRNQLPTERVDFGTVHLMWRGEKPQFRAYSRVRMHEWVAANGFDHGDEAVHPAMAVVQSGLSDVRSLLVAGDAALRDHGVTHRSLRLAAQALHGQRGIIAARAALEWCDARHESPGETLTALMLRRLGYAFTPQFEVARVEAPGRTFRADFLIDGTRVLVEFDGAAKNEERQANVVEKRREDELRRMGYVVVRLTWRELSDQELVRHRIAQAIRLAALLSA